MVAHECCENQDVRRCLMRKIGVSLRREMKAMCSDKVNSLLRAEVKPEGSALWQSIGNELERHAPILLNFLSECAQSKRHQLDNKKIACITAVILLKHRWWRMSALHKTVSLILYAGHTSKMVYYI